MKFINIVSNSYDKAYHKAINQYGPSLRITLRRDYVEGCLVKKHYCQLICYQDNECPKSKIELGRIDFNGFKEKINENNDEVFAREGIDYSKKYKAYFYEDDIQQLQLKNQHYDPQKLRLINQDKIEKLLKQSKIFLKENNFYQTYSLSLQNQLKAWLISNLPQLPAAKDYERYYLERISNSFECDHTTQLFPPENFVLLQKTKNVKAQTSLKVSYWFSNLKKEQVNNIQLKYNNAIKENSCDLVLSEDFLNCKVIYQQQSLYKTFNKTNSLNVFDSYVPNNVIEKQALVSFLKLLDKNNCKHFLILNTNEKEPSALDILNLSNIPFDGIIFTSADKIINYGPLISLCASFKLPVLFITDGNKMPENIHFASNYYIMSQLKGKKSI